MCGIETMRIPKGLRSKAQGWRRTPTLGKRALEITTPKGFWTRCVWKRVRNPVGVDEIIGMITQGSSCLATLGFVSQSLWDWPGRIPTGFRNEAQGWRRTPTLGNHASRFTTPSGLRIGRVRSQVRNPVGVEINNGDVTQGSSLLATLGFWQARAAEMSGHFKRGEFTEGLLHGISKAGICRPGTSRTKRMIKTSCRTK